jgi:hypothetical protein
MKHVFGTVLSQPLRGIFWLVTLIGLALTKCADPNIV